MRFPLLALTLSAFAVGVGSMLLTASEPSAGTVHDADQLKLEQICRTLGGVDRAWQDEDGVHAQCRNGLRVGFHASQTPGQVAKGRVAGDQTLGASASLRQ